MPRKRITVDFNQANSLSDEVFQQGFDRPGTVNGAEISRLMQTLQGYPFIVPESIRITVTELGD